MSEKPIVVVTGASGFVATNVIHKLLERGYPTRGTVRSLKDEAKVAPLRKLFPKLELYEADLLKDGSFDEVLKGATYVLHTASPFILEVKDPIKELIEPAVHGTKTVLEGATKAGTVKRVVLTSSIAAVAGKRPPGHVYTDEDWNLDSTPTFEPYRYSKRMAEETAWNYVKEHKGFDLVVINPSFVLGPPLLARDDATSIKTVQNFFQGKVNASCFGVVDVRDVAEAHIRAFENPSAHGRYLVTSPDAVPNLELSKILATSGKFPQYADVLPTKADFPPPNILHYSRAKAEKELGIEFKSVETSIVDMAQAMIDLGLVAKK